MDTLTAGQFSLVYNAFSFTFATMGAATVFLWLSRSQVGPAYKTALTISGLVTAMLRIAARRRKISRVMALFAVPA